MNLNKIDPPLTPKEELIVAIFDEFQQVCYLNAKDKGFWRDQDELEYIVDQANVTHQRSVELLKALRDAFHAMKGDLMHSELGERTEAQRKTLESDKVPGISGEEEELADTIIRMGDYSGRRRFRLGLAIVLKMRYNNGRPYMHGKQF